MGSDHIITATWIATGPAKPKKKVCKIINWEKFRQHSQETGGEIRDIEEWTARLKRMAEDATTTIPEEAEF